jgi:hypothetical protein
MKKLATIAASVAMVLMAVAIGWADMVNIGTGEMESSEFEALKAMVAGHPPATEPVVSTPLVQPVRYGMVEMTVDAYESLRDQVAGAPAGLTHQPGAVQKAAMVDIGTGQMPRDEFMALKKMIENKDAFMSDHLAVFLP